MQKILMTICFLGLLFSACTAESSHTETMPEENKTDTAIQETVNKYPEALEQIFAKHGGLENWQKMKALSYEIVKEAGNEKQFIDLKNRREKIEAADFITGYDGKDFWLEADTTNYKGNPVFYHNLMFYFYAMPFVLADDGIIYSETEPLRFDGKTYPGIRIAYEDGVGVSSKDEYFIYYDAATFEMAWLGYTVTYYSDEKSDKLGWIRYDDWKTFKGLLLPNSLTWYKTEEGEITEPKRTRMFANVTIQTTAFEDETFAKTANAIVVE